MRIVASLAHEVGVSAACSALDVSRVVSTDGRNPKKKNRPVAILLWPFRMKNVLKSSIPSMRTALSIKPLKRFMQHFLMKSNTSVLSAPCTVFWKQRES